MSAVTLLCGIEWGVDEERWHVPSPLTTPSAQPEWRATVQPTQHEIIIETISTDLINLWQPISWMETPAEIAAHMKNKQGQYPQLAGIDLDTVDWQDIFDELAER